MLIHPIYIIACIIKYASIFVFDIDSRETIHQSSMPGMHNQSMAKEPDSIIKKIEKALVYPATIDEEKDDESARNAVREGRKLKQKLKDEVDADMDS